MVDFREKIPKRNDSRGHRSKDEINFHHMQTYQNISKQLKVPQQLTWNIHKIIQWDKEKETTTYTKHSHNTKHIVNFSTQ